VRALLLLLVSHSCLLSIDSRAVDLGRWNSGTGPPGGQEA
jgi:hypothetical protein